MFLSPPQGLYQYVERQNNITDLKPTRAQDALNELCEYLLGNGSVKIGLNQEHPNSKGAPV